MKINRVIIRLNTILTSKPILPKILVLVLMSAIIGYGLFVRFAPFYLNGFEFFEYDSYIEYWQAKYVFEKGILSWYSLTRENPDTHIFWYPWGRDIIYTSYPLLPMWIGGTYSLIQYTGLGLKEWAVLQPLIFTLLGLIAAYLAATQLSGGNRFAGLLTSFLLAFLPAANDRTLIGFVEKEGVSIFFIFMFLFFYGKTVSSLKQSFGRKTILYSVLTALFLGFVGWLWGGYIFLLGSLTAYFIISPLFLGKEFNEKFIKTNILIIGLSMLFTAPSPSIFGQLGFYPLRLSGIGWPILGSCLIPMLYYYLGIQYKRLGLRKPLLSKTRYFMLLVLLVVGGSIAITTGVLGFAGRWAWALGLRFIPADPLVQSIAEHQSPLSSAGTLFQMLRSWGLDPAFPWSILFPVAPLSLSIIGALYMILYKQTPETLFVAILFFLSFYSYLNAAYMIAMASYMGTIVAGIFLGYLVQRLVPTQQEIQDYKRGRVRVTGRSNRLVILAFIVLFLVNSAHIAYLDYQTNSSIIYTFKAGNSNLALYSDSWYKIVETLRNDLPVDAVVISWWDYGYGISVDGGRASVADGSTLNFTQIGILGLLLTSVNTSEAASLAKLFNTTPGKTYVLVLELFAIYEDNETVIIWPVLFPNSSMPGGIDIPKSIWMIRIGNATVDTLKSQGINVSYRVTSDYLVLIGNQFISPMFNQPDRLPLIYRMMVDGMLYWGMMKNKSSIFAWYGGSTSPLSTATVSRIRELVGIEVTLGLNNPVIDKIQERPLANDTFFRPYAIIAEPFYDPKTDELVKIGVRNPDNPYETFDGVLYSVGIIYEITSIP
ncbi:MAG: peptide transporter [Thermosphaera aggregans]|jgi:dolichyl-diphosphooligosaccharide--protein glycosyltransferase|uniref:peptide transporter n=1 Tax=Thermosphaera aggregans TaxID=54254 RepID=UPI003BFBC992